MDNSCLIVMYHYVRDTQDTEFPEIKALAVKDFEAQLDWLQAHFELVSLAQLEEAINCTNTYTNPLALLTFDDGFVDHYETVWPILKKRGLTGLFFVSTSSLVNRPVLLNVHKTHFLMAKLGTEFFIEEVWQGLNKNQADLELELREREGLYRYDKPSDLDVKRLLNYELPYDLADNLLEQLFTKHLGSTAEFANNLYLSNDMITTMSKEGAIFGAHTLNHRVLSRLSLSEQKTELSSGLEALKRICGQESLSFCYPYGHTHTYNEDTLELLHQLGYTAAFNTQRSVAKLSKTQCYEIPRLDTKDLPPFKEVDFS